MLRAAAMLETLFADTLYPAPPDPVPSPPPAPLVEVVLPSATGERIVAWSSGDQRPPAGRPAVLFLHGNGENLEVLRRGRIFDLLQRSAVAFLAVDYPGYGRSTGRPGEASLLAAAEAGLARLRHEHPRRPRVVCGWSLGAAVAVALAARRQGELAGLALLAPWSSLADMAARLYPAPLVRPLAGDRYDSLSLAPRLRLPALVLHGEGDDTVPPEQGARVARALARPTRWVLLPHADHNTLLALERT